MRKPCEVRGTCMFGLKAFSDLELSPQSLQSEEAEPMRENLVLWGAGLVQKFRSLTERSLRGRRSRETMSGGKHFPFTLLHFGAYPKPIIHSFSVLMVSLSSAADGCNFTRGFHCVGLELFLCRPRKVAVLVFHLGSQRYEKY